MLKTTTLLCFNSLFEMLPATKTKVEPPVSGFNSLFEMPKQPFRGRLEILSYSFNSLFEMQRKLT